MVANGDGNGARKLDDDAAMRLLSKLYDHDDDLDDVAEEETPAEPAGAEAGFRELRSVFAEMRESLAEEPPARGMEALLAAAAANVAKPAPRRAAVVEPEPGFFAKMRAGWMRLMAHPGMMAAAGLVVVAGVAGTIYFKTGAVDGGASESETRASTAAVTEERARPSAGELQRTGDGAGNSASVGQGALNPAPQQAPIAHVEEPVVADQPSQAEKGKVASPAKPDSKPPSKTAPKPSPKSERNSFGYQKEAGAGGASGGSKQNADMEDESAPPAPPPAVAQPMTRAAPVSKPVAPSKAKSPAVAADPQPAPEAAPPSEAPPRGNSTVKKPMDLAIDGADKATSTAAGKDAPTAASLLTSAKAAAAKGDCVRARALAEQARTSDKRAYDLALKNDAKLRQCFAAAN